ncbi:DUF4259 domain-containing protein [Streptomyces sp. SCSIO 30461]|uniref:DUF4259 domain-containing protein n=1 Tax=Streptomyces sp. SCSIO 30461 TaxID=3118085 RepID=UPI0030D4AE3D
MPPSTWYATAGDNPRAQRASSQPKSHTTSVVTDCDVQEGTCPRAFQRVTDSGARVDGGDGAEAVAAGALVASALPDSPIVIDPDDGPGEPLPELPASLRASARLALDRVLQDGSEMATGWVDSGDLDQWRQEVRQIPLVLETSTDH